MDRRVHFTPGRARLTGPTGVRHAEGRYHLSYGGGRATSPDLVLWTEQPAGPDPATPVTRPAGVAAMRDPQVEADGDGWRMVLAARLADGDGALLQYRSGDARSWSYEGILLRRPGAGSWECPQFFAMGDDWVLLVSTPGQGVTYALGDYDGRRFFPRAWGDFGPLAATTTFLDVAGRRCALSWLREGALSAPWVLSARGDRLLAALHPDLDRYLVDGGTGLRVDGNLLRDGDDVLLDLPPGGEITVLADADLVEAAVEGVSGLSAARRTGAGEAGARLLRFASGPGGQPGAHASR